MMAKDLKPPQSRPNSEGPVRLEAWLAANQPRLHPTQRKVLQAVADLSAGGVQVPSSTVRERLGMSQQLLNRHLRALEGAGLVHLESAGAGLPLLAKASGLGLRALGLRGPQPAAKGDDAPAAPDEAPAPADSLAVVEEPAPSDSRPVSSRARLARFIDQLYQDLAPYLESLSHGDFRRLVGASAAQALGKAKPAAPAAPPSPVSPPPPEASVPEARETAPAGAGAPATLGEELSRLAAGTGLAPRRRASDGPELNPAERALEDRLAQSTHPEQRHCPWWERTRELSSIWDQMRRHRLGVLGTYFTTFGPRWQRPDWEHFNRARRQADARGASYQDWVTAQFDRLRDQGDGGVSPADLHGDEAAQAWQTLRQDQAQAQGRHVPGPPPYTPESFNVHNPDHAAYAEELLEEIGFLASRVYGDDPDGPILLLVQAVGQGTLPLQALDLRPAWREKVMAAMTPVSSPRLPGPGEALRVSPAQVQPPIII